MADETAEPRPFVEIPLKEFVDNGILLAANEAFFWPLGLALTVTRDDDNRYVKLDVRQWEPPEVITFDETDPVYEVRREAFSLWETKRRETLIP